MTHYGCHSKPRKDGYWAKDQQHVDGYLPLESYVYIKDKMTQTCNYRQTTPNDPRCEGCTCE